MDASGAIISNMNNNTKCGQNYCCAYTRHNTKMNALKAIKKGRIVYLMETETTSGSIKKTTHSQCSRKVDNENDLCWKHQDMANKGKDLLKFSDIENNDQINEIDETNEYFIKAGKLITCNTVKGNTKINVKSEIQDKINKIMDSDKKSQLLKSINQIYESLITKGEVYLEMADNSSDDEDFKQQLNDSMSEPKVKKKVGKSKQKI